jgi:hypothetical protein
MTTEAAPARSRRLLAGADAQAARISS